MKIRIVALGLQPPLTDAIYNHGEEYTVSDEQAVDFLNRSWAVIIKEPVIEKAVVMEEAPETATGKRQRKV